MTHYRFYADQADGAVIEMKKVQKRDILVGWTGAEWVPITRTVKRKSVPSLHECDARCMGASGRSMQCECSCGGKNHGRSAFTCVAA